MAPIAPCAPTSIQNTIVQPTSYIIDWCHVHLDPTFDYDCGSFVHLEDGWEDLPLDSMESTFLDSLDDVNSVMDHRRYDPSIGELAQLDSLTEHTTASFSSGLVQNDDFGNREFLDTFFPRNQAQAATSQRTKRSASAGIPGVSSFYSRPPTKRSRRAVTVEDRERIDELRHKGACLQCRRLRLQCSVGDPCQHCLKRRSTIVLPKPILGMCVRSFADANLFERWKPSPIAYTSFPVFPEHFTSAIRYLPSFFQLLCIEQCQIPRIHIRDEQQHEKQWTKWVESWVKSGNQALIGLDSALKKKSFWFKDNIETQLDALALANLIASFCFCQAAFAYFTVEQPSAACAPECLPPRERLETFIDCCVFDMEKLFHLRSMIIRHLNLGVEGIYHKPATQCGKATERHPWWNARATVLNLEDLVKREQSVPKCHAPFKELLHLPSSLFWTGNICDHALSIGLDHDFSDKAMDQLSVLHRAVLWNNIAALRSFLHGGADIEHEDRLGRTPLLLAIEFGRNVALNELIENHAALQSSNARALHVAARVGNTYAVGLLLRLGEDPNVVTTDGDTALHIAARENRVPAIQTLLEWVANLDIANCAGQTALQIAVENDCFDAATELLRI